MTELKKYTEIKKETSRFFRMLGMIINHPELLYDIGDILISHSQEETKWLLKKKETFWRTN